MSPWRRVVVLVSRLRGLFARRRLARDAQQEIEMHLDLLAAQYVRAGNPPAEARRLARAKFGGVTQLQESLRDQAGFPMLESIVRDVRYALRGLRRSPGFSLIVVLTLGVGIGANAAVFSFVNAVLLRPLPYAEADRLVAVQETSPPSPFFVTPGDYVDWKERNEVFETLSGYAYSLSGLVGPSGDAELLFVAATSADFFRTLRVRPLLGRTFRPGEDQAGRDHVAVLGHGLWTRRFGGEPDVVGREITLDGRARTVIGVMPPAFEFPTGAREVWTPLVLAEASRNDRRNHSMMTVARLRPGVTLRQARARMEALGVRLAEIHPRTNAGRGVEVVELRHQQRGVTGPFLVLGQLAAVLVLLIACANVSNLQLGRVTSRGREMTIRAALGAGRWRLGRLVVIESLLLALAGSGVGMGVAAWGVAVLRDGISPEMSRWVQGFRDVAVDWPVLAFSLAVAVVAGVAFGLAAASGAWRPAVMGRVAGGYADGDARPGFPAPGSGRGRGGAGRRDHRLCRADGPGLPVALRELARLLRRGRRHDVDPVAGRANPGAATGRRVLRRPAGAGVRGSRRRARGPRLHPAGQSAAPSDGRAPDRGEARARTGRDPVGRRARRQRGLLSYGRHSPPRRADVRGPGR